MTFAVERSGNGQTVRISVRGELDMHTGPRLQEELERAELEPGGRLVLDLTGVTFFDSTGLQIVVDADERARGSGRSLEVAISEGEVQRVLELAQVHDRLTFEAPPEG